MEETAQGSDLKNRVRRILVDEVAPALHLDPGGIEVLGISEGVVQLRVQGACAGCPSSIMTLLMGVEQELRQRIPEIEYLEALP